MYTFVPKNRNVGNLAACQTAASTPNAMIGFMKTALLSGLCVWCSLSAVAQYARRDSHAVRRKSPTSLAVDEASRRYQTKFDSLIASFHHWRYEEADTLNNPYYASLMGSPTLYGGTLKRVMGVLPETPQEPVLQSSAKVYELTEAADAVLVSAYTLCPWLVRYEEAEQGTLNVESKIREGVKPEFSLTERFGGENPSESKQPLVPALDDELHIKVRKPNFWTFTTNLSIKFTQNHVSDNWYKGGESSNSLLGSMTFRANYNNQRKVTFNNTLEMKLGFQTSENDEQHKYKTNSDLLRLTNQLGLRAINHWDYTVMLQSWTQFYPGYRSNDPKVYSDFMSPFEALLSVGMKYNMKTKNQKFSVDATLAPVSLKLKYVDRKHLATSFGISEGHQARWDWGPNITVNYTWNIMKNLSWASRIYYFTDYSKSQVEWENTFNFTINKYLKGSLFLYPRFDDSRTRKEGETYFQFNELLSFGLDFTF